MDPILGTIIIFAGNFAPRGWMLCWGQLLPISQNQALFSILGTFYGGDGVTTFALPDLRGRVPVGQGQGPGLSNYVLGEKTGTENMTLTINQMPIHTHVATTAMKVSSQQGDQVTPVAASSISAVKDINGDPAKGFSSQSPDVGLTNAVTNTNGMTGGSMPFSLLQPILGVNYIIAMQGLYPSRN
ncbi:phage tail protein [Pedobacter sp. HMWF019]|uniref:phage tail protein n=1 Tax=Pedobacter sp. HMWF019 TaxID=2056856 RepID=UPI000D3A27C5|nr:tail fiber protein [Pedobacter sp. HMWF019]PTS92322.1 phage tail protein [Pedobacter sp. HMWF019]